MALVVRYVFATFDRYTAPMTPVPFSDSPSKKNLAFILRFMWDEETADWVIHLKPVEGSASHQFTNPEALLFYLESQTLKTIR